MVSRIAVLGAGRIGRIHAANVAATDGMSLAVVVDVDEQAAVGLAQRFGAAVSPVEQVLADPEVDGVVVATSTDTHLDLTLRAVAAGKAVLCEKPVDADLDRARGALEQLDGERILIGFNRRFDPGFATLQAKVASGELGSLESLQITSNDPAPPPADYVRGSGGMFVDMSIHDFDMARFLLGEEPSEVFAWGSCLVDPAIGDAGDIDTARIMLRTASGRLCVIANSRRSGFGYDQRIEAFCSGGLVTARNQTETNVETWVADGAHLGPFRNFFLDRYADAFRAEMRHFADVVTGTALPSVNFGDGVAALALAAAASESLATGSPVTLGREARR